MCVMVATGGSQSVLRGTLNLWHEKLRPFFFSPFFFQGYSTLRLVCFFKKIKISSKKKSEKMMPGVCACC